MTTNRPSLPDAVATNSAAGHVDWFPLVRLEFDSATSYLAGLAYDVDYDGHTWLAALGIGSIEPIIESGDEIAGLRFSLAGVSTAVIAQAQTEQYQGRKVSVLWATIDAAGVLAVDPAAWEGRLDIPTIERGQQTCTVSVTAEHRMVDWKRPRKLLFNHADQQRILAGDNFFLGLESMSERTITLFSRDVLLADWS